MFNSKITITHKASGVVVMEYLIDLHSPDETLANYFDEAWDCAVHESLVNPLQRSGYDFLLMKEFIN